VYAKTESFTQQRLKKLSLSKNIDKLGYNIDNLEAYDYVVNSKSALKWIIKHYQITKDSGITNDPNDWVEDPHYIINSLKRIVWMNFETVKIVS
jgi:predicted helicase